MRSALALFALLLALTGCANTTPNRTVNGPTLPPRQTTTTPCDPAPYPLDDRTTATDLVYSYFNAIDRKDYHRAYAYFTPRDPQDFVGALPQQPDYATWQAGYATTNCVILTYVGAEAPVTDATPGYQGVGNGIVVPTRLTAYLSDGSLLQFAGVYTIRDNPAVGMAATGAIDVRFSQLTNI